MAYTSAVYTQLDQHEKHLIQHDAQISELDKCATRNATNIGSLITQIKWLTSSLWGITLLLLAALVSFFLKS